MQLKINLTHLKSKIFDYVKEYYSLTEKPALEEIPKEYKWIQAMIAPYIEYAIVNLELKDHNRIEVHERMVEYKHQPVQSKCIQKKGYDIEKQLGDRSNKFLLKGNKAAKVVPIAMYLYKQRNEMKSVINNEFEISKKAESLGIGPKTYDTFICFNEVSQVAYKVVVTEYTPGVSLEEWLDTNPSVEERTMVYELVKAKIDTMHSNGIIHDGLKWHSNNIILKKTKAGKIVDAVITDYVKSYDTKDKNMWDFNKWIQQDRYVLDRIKSGDVYSYDNSDDVTNYVTMKLKKHIVVV